MRNVVMSVQVPAKVYERWARRRGFSAAALEEVIVRFLENYQFPVRSAGVLEPTGGSRYAARHRPLHAEVEWNRRWYDWKGEVEVHGVDDAAA
ncbi:hypothetical protein RD110_23710 [Rhodoferax koreense]|uniref:Uncharacterized protein n=1 Tax=Rhodoferax koreensis TaxID=1842727 RepID=A0A1P8K1G8_9BURK|nr:hypothetical protein [Rhodoferax koreense]APW39836.1 hypothetical protein RD110_23710 [Rhodoferax koreense]